MKKKSDKSRCDATKVLEECIAEAKGEMSLQEAQAIVSSQQRKDGALPDGIAVMGSHPQTVQQGPWDHNWLIYACSPHNLHFASQDGKNPNLRYLPGGVRADGGTFRVDEWFEVHLPLAHETRPYDYLRELEKLDIVWMRDQDGLSRIKGARAYPEKEMKERFGPFTFTSSIAFILAKAIVDCERMGIPRLGIWGVMQASQNEYCMVPDTRALTANLEWVPVGDLEVGQELLAFDEYAEGNQRRAWRKSVVDATGLKKMPCYRMDMADGTTMISSAAHKWLNGEYKWVRSDNVRAEGDYPGATRILKLLEPWKREESWDAGYLAAAVDGEGHLTQFENNENSYQCRIGFAQRENAMRREVLAAASRLGFEFSEKQSMDHNLLGGKAKTLEFLGKMRPPRLLSQFDADRVGEMRARSFVPVESIEYIGEREVVTLSTSTGTFVAEGFASHNTFQRPGIQNLIWEATKAGVEVVCPQESRLFEPQPENF